MVTLSGTTTPCRRPNIGIAPQLVNLSDQTAAPQGTTRIITVTNLGGATLNFTGITLSGVNAVKLSVAPNVIPFSANPVNNPTNTRCVNISGVGTLAPRANCVFFYSLQPDEGRRQNGKGECGD